MRSTADQILVDSRDEIMDAVWAWAEANARAQGRPDRVAWARRDEAEDALFAEIARVMEARAAA